MLNILAEESNNKRLLYELGTFFKLYSSKRYLIFPPSDVVLQKKVTPLPHTTKKNHESKCFYVVGLLTYVHCPAYALFCLLQIRPIKYCGKIGFTWINELQHLFELIIDQSRERERCKLRVWITCDCASLSTNNGAVSLLTSKTTILPPLLRNM